MSTFGERFKQLRLEKGLTQEKLAEMFFTKKSSISRYENNIQIPEIEALQKYADFFGVSVDYLLARTDYRDILPKGAWKAENFIKLPVLGIIKAGEPLLAEQNIIGYEYIASDILPIGECFFLKVSGDSMNLSNIIDGSLVLVRKQEDVDNGEIAVVIVNGENATIKRFFKTNTTITLMPHSSNPLHQPIVFDSKTTDFKVIGKVIQCTIKF